ncbi:hypothetical protein M758_8G028700 [Ceratodon purpureus]|nr:hypothetical protein M758_8G028700 [Ceratodon purpureus]
MAPGKKLEVEVVMCCQGCVDNVEEVLNETHGISSYKIERYDSRVFITENPNGGPDRKQLVKNLKKKTHDKKAEILRRTDSETKPSTPKPTTTTTVVYTGYPYMGPGYLVPWPPSAPSSSSVITNPNYFQHPVRCHYCAGYSDIVCGNCGRGSNYNV